MNAEQWQEAFESANDKLVAMENAHNREGAHKHSDIAKQQAFVVHCSVRAFGQGEHDRINRDNPGWRCTATCAGIAG